MKHSEETIKAADNYHFEVGSEHNPQKHFLSGFDHRQPEVDELKRKINQLELKLYDQKYQHKEDNSCNTAGHNFQWRSDQGCDVCAKCGAED